MLRGAARLKEGVKREGKMAAAGVEVMKRSGEPKPRVEIVYLDFPLGWLAITEVHKE